jgi:alkanesulfonate monooxygenase SsuD/methylene tetrahydromethanopterin reductase-like flavin-dependent oxidoreductase (luciferase family)
MNETTEPPIRFTVRLPHSLRVADPAAIRTVATLAEELGFYGVSVQDHILLDAGSAPCYTGDADPRTVYSALTTLAYLAGVTETVKLLTTVVVAGYRHPVMLAKEAATLDALSGGRLILGFGVGASRTRQAAEGFLLSHHASIATREFDALGVSGHRGRLADETLRVLDMIWTQESATFAGETVSFEDLDVFPKPVQRPRPPILIGGRSEAALRRTALLADGWCPSHESPEHFALGRRRALDIAAEAGRPAPTWWGTNIDLAIATSRDAAEEKMTRGFGRLFETRDAMLNATLTGTPEDILDRLRVWRRAGLNLADIKIVPRDLDDTLEQMAIIGKEILPVLPELTG